MQQRRYYRDMSVCFGKVCKSIWKHVSVEHTPMCVCVCVLRSQGDRRRRAEETRSRARDVSRHRARELKCFHQVSSTPRLKASRGE